MKKIFIIIIASLTILLSGCGTSGTFSDDGSVRVDNSGNIVGSSSGGGGVPKVKVTISLCETYTTVQTSDAVVKNSDSTVLKINSYSDGIKEICIVSGSAYILR
ncbi:MAG: hypothetical protein GQ570_04405 [Helicobacteraceae bacterium]|nr:hypothetical protein [Helicobacteraceae bacterium]